MINDNLVKKFDNLFRSNDKFALIKRLTETRRSRSSREVLVVVIFMRFKRD